MLKFLAMKTQTFSLFLAFTFLASGQVHAQATDAEMPARMGGQRAPTRTYSSSTQSTGTIIRKGIRWESRIPLNKTYEQFSESEKAEFHALYESMPPGDEPPFPVDGLRPVFNSIKKGQQIVRARGQINMVVTVDADGKATEVADLGGIGGANALEMTRFAGSVLLMTKFKPAVCAGKPCKSQFPFILDLRLH